MPLFEVKNLTKHFGGLAAVESLNFSINKGEITGLIGPNGAGKTTVFNMISGVFPPTKGKTVFLGKNITRLKPNKRAAMGIARTFQITTLFDEMTVMQNVLLGGFEKSGAGFLEIMLNTGSARAKAAENLENAEEIIEFMGLSGQKHELAKNLPHGFQMRLELAIALAVKPVLLLLDEPLTGMNQEEIKIMLYHINEIRKQGCAILLVEHNMRAVTSICDSIVVLNFGRKIAQGIPRDIIQNKEVIKAYLGDEE